jgi:hypothetical protein
MEAGVGEGKSPRTHLLQARVQLFGGVRGGRGLNYLERCGPTIQGHTVLKRQKL